ncbi:RNA polymerase sigma factor [Gottfriedia acidiceleris]|uniref:RNA polymerase sigma factor n=1 Tax=Gottfriedia acidiceleris TaxID=371036 RepID=UPI000B437562|nr:RNA polymerase sigma factor [Gottfriedia acidiceleris]
MGNEEIDQLLIKTAKNIYGYLLKIGVNRADADDIVQDTLNKALLTIYQVDITYIKTWLFQIAINKHRDLLRRRRRIEQFPLESVQLIGTKGLEEAILTKEMQLEIQKVLNQLNPMYKHILLLKYDFELSYKEISVLLEMKEETVKTSLYRARNEFKKIYRRENDEE